MAKRFFSTDLWDKDDFNSAPQKIKLLTLFIFAKCDCIGVFRMSPRLVTAYIGEPISETDILGISAKIEKLSDGVYWLTDFCYFQYGELNSSCKAHQKYIRVLKECGLFDRVCKGYAKGMHTLEEEEEEKEQEEEKEKEEERGVVGEKTIGVEIVAPTLDEVKDKAFVAGVPNDKAEAFYHHYNSQGWNKGNGQKITDLVSALVNWRNKGYQFESKIKPGTSPRGSPKTCANCGSYNPRMDIGNGRLVCNAACYERLKNREAKNDSDSRKNV